MDPRYHVESLREACLVMNEAQSAHGVSGSTASYSGYSGLTRPSRRPAFCVGHFCTNDSGSNGRNRRGQGSAPHVIDLSREHEATNNRAV